MNRLSTYSPNLYLKKHLNIFVKISVSSLLHLNKNIPFLLMSKGEKKKWEGVEKS